ncbi:hypothetical protein ANTHELSMS3_03451 [Antarctobacter heliothermus]|uniref:Uncharacterized protein n=1 Tax=Antarctobacter heliothermus TaxID=74033 RepID=A0A222E7Z0_9RHOB|nr:hypothetical protein ANTHELSMS3_03451 [Antarctobacter heliothermus]
MDMPSDSMRWIIALDCWLVESCDISSAPPRSGYSDPGHGAADDGQERIARVLQQEATISDLDRVWKRFRNGACIPAIAIPCVDLDLRMPTQPNGDGRGFSKRQKVDDGASLAIADQRPVALPQATKACNARGHLCHATKGHRWGFQIHSSESPTEREVILPRRNRCRPISTLGQSSHLQLWHRRLCNGGSIARLREGAASACLG